MYVPPTDTKFFFLYYLHFKVMNQEAVCYFERSTIHSLLQIPL